MKSAGTAFIDSGTTFVYFSDDLYAKYREVYTAFCAKNSTNCGGNLHKNKCHIFNLKKHKSLFHFFATFPNMTFTFDKTKTITWFPEDYLYNIEGTKYYCVGIEAMKDAIFGSIFWKNYDILIDKDTRTVEVTRSNCSQAIDNLPFISRGKLSR